MSDSWVCLMVDNKEGMLSEEIRTALQIAACHAYVRGRLACMRFTSSVCSGIVESEWKEHTIGSRTGVFFRAQIETDEGNYRANFLFDPTFFETGEEAIRKLEDSAGMWTPQGGRLPLDEMYQFDDLGWKKRLN